MRHTAENTILDKTAVIVLFAIFSDLWFRCCKANFIVETLKYMAVKVISFEGHKEFFVKSTFNPH